MTKQIVIVGHGHATQGALSQILKYKTNQKISIISGEATSGYHKPPLSKEFLTTPTDKLNLYFRNNDFYEKNRINIISNTVIHNIDCNKKILISDSGAEYPFDQLIIATGARPKSIPITKIGSPTTLHLNSMHEALKLKEAALKTKKLCIIGGGFIGLETACSLSRYIPDITLIEKEDRILKRTNHAEIAKALHMNAALKGIKILTNESVNEIVNTQKQYLIKTGQHLIKVNLILEAAGSTPNIEWLKESAIKINNGILVNSKCQTNIADIYAAGDCTEYVNPINGKPSMTTAVSHAHYQGRIAGRNLFKGEEELHDFPWFWSHQGDMHLQMVGYPELADESVITKKGSGQLTITHFMGDQLVGVESLNEPITYAKAKKILSSQKSVDKSLVDWL